MTVADPTQPEFIYLAGRRVGAMAYRNDADFSTYRLDDETVYCSLVGALASDAVLPPTVRLALAVLQGDVGAALLLADRVQEDYTGGQSDLRAAIAKQVDMAVLRERSTCGVVACNVNLDGVTSVVAARNLILKAIVYRADPAGGTKET